MDSVLIGNINEVAMPNDRIFNLGDLGDNKRLESWLARINCKNIFAVPGNHDKEQLLRRYVTVLPQCYMYKSQDFQMVLCHYAMRVWPHSHHGAGHLYGHSHGTLSPTITEDGKGAMAFDIGVDCWNFKPLNTSQVITEMKRRSVTNMIGSNRMDDHHKPR
jgi:calcineurin-like phosphoesterase family protein